MLVRNAHDVAHDVRAHPKDPDLTRVPAGETLDVIQAVGRSLVAQGWTEVDDLDTDTDLELEADEPIADSGEEAE